MYFSRYCVRHLMEKLEMNLKVIKAIRVCLNEKNSSQSYFCLTQSRANKLYMKFKVLIIYALTQYNTVRIYEMYKNNLTV